MEKNTSVNMGNESSAHNNINDIVLKKKTLNSYDEINNYSAQQYNNNNQYNNNQYGNNQYNNNQYSNQNNNPYNNNQSNNNYQYGNQNNRSTVIKKEEFRQTDPNYQSGILEKREIKEDRKPSVLIIFIIIVAVFFGEIIYHAIFNKNTSDEPNVIENNNQNENNNIDNSQDNIFNNDFDNNIIDSNF